MAVVQLLDEAAPTLLSQSHAVAQKLKQKSCRSRVAHSSLLLA
jgi:hypothetical protein